MPSIRAIVIMMLALVVAATPAARGQNAPVNGIRPADLRGHAIVNATVVVRPGVVLEDATVLMEDGVITAVGADVAVPPGTRVWPGAGRHVYPGLIDASVLLSAEPLPAAPGRHWNELVRPERDMADYAVPDAALRKTLRGLGFTVAAVHPADGVWRGRGSVVALADDPEHERVYGHRGGHRARHDMMSAGFDRGAPYPSSHMGAIALMRQTLLDARWHARCRDVWTARPQGNEPPLPAEALVALDDVAHGRQPVLFEVQDELEALRAGRIASEFGLELVLLTSGLEFRRLDEITALGVPLVVPLDFPERPDVSSLVAADAVSLRAMMTWEQAPTNPRRLVDAGATIALTTHGLEKRRDFPARLRSAIRHGLTEDAALAALTTAPARLLGLDDVMGTIEAGKAAHLVVVEGALFDENRTIHDVWVNGRRIELEPSPPVTLAGRGTLTIKAGDGGAGPAHTVELDTTRHSFTVVPGAGAGDAKKTRAKKVVVQRDRLAVVIDGRPFEAEGYVHLSGVVEAGRVVGVGRLPDGRDFAFTIAMNEEDGDADAAAAKSLIAGTWEGKASVEAPDDAELSLTLKVAADGSVAGQLAFGETRYTLKDAVVDVDAGTVSAVAETEADAADLALAVTGDEMTGTLEGVTRVALTASRAAVDGEDAFEMPPATLALPLGAYGLAATPTAETVHVKNATIWTCGPDGVLEDADLVVQDGRIRAVGRRLATPPGARVIDGRGRHVTPGLIDCHSHTGISGGVNEMGQTNTAEVRIADVVDPDSIGWYRELAGGLTAANQLHGSANPIGGQNCVVKLAWGGSVDDYRIPDAIEGIKFALGENVKRRRTRYPNTRMGVETFIVDAFTAARAYRDEWSRFNALSAGAREGTMPPRRDLELEALVEIIEGERLVHCHSYRQDEILMLIRVADAFGFTIGTFQHVLEGYKVADAIAAHGAGASSFSDWWAYKVEVMDAIPYNGALMHDVGVLVSFNSDSGELARRMNTEASKAVRYGGLDPHEALKFVTLNPARQLRIDHRTGSLEKGKDADLAIWSASPLSTYARCEQTWVDGVCRFDLETDRQLRLAADAERRRLIQKILADTHGPPTLASAGELTEGEDATPTEPAPSARTQAPSELDAAWARWMEEEIRLGRDPHEIRPGCCADVHDTFHDAYRR